MSDSHVYVKDKEHGWLPAKVLHNQGNTVRVKVYSVDATSELDERTESLQDYSNQTLPLQNVDASGALLVVPDMVDLPSLHEAAILYNLRARHLQKKPYTRVGDLIIAVNPFQWMQDFYSESTRSQYVDKLVWHTTESPTGTDVRATLPPHVYETSSLAYRGLAVEGRHQSILVSGESGAGKTETVKIVMSHLASVMTAAAGHGETDHHHLVVQRVLDSHPLLEAFGNAKTARNDNSSRFGKFIQMQFDVEDATTAQFSGRAVPNCVLAGSTCETYLLEKSRVVGHEKQERTYHIFYQLLAAPEKAKKDIWEGLVGKTNESFRYVGATETTAIEGKTDAERWKRTVQALEALDIIGNALKTLMQALCVVLQLGNIEFDKDTDDSEKSFIASTDELTALADLIGIDAEHLGNALTHRTVVAGKESYTVPLKVSAARDGCDAVAKEIYQQSFDWLVRQINCVTCAEANYDDASDVEEYGLIGLLDIFGFESFEINRFEQLCINYTNEKLQQKYTLDIFRSVQEEYGQEGIELGEIVFDDNADVLRLIEGRVGIISVLNEECVRPNGNDTAFVSKVKSVNDESCCLISEKLHKPSEFAIQHYAGMVTYDATSFVQKNTDALPKDIIECACLSSNELIKVELKVAADKKAKAANEKAPGKRGASALTVTTKFKHQLGNLMHDVTKTQTRYIRCIKPNTENIPLQMNMSSSAEQLRCAGVVAAVTISRVAFPNRLMHETTLERFGCLGHVDLGEVMEEKKEETASDKTGYSDAVNSLLASVLQCLEVKKEGGSVARAFEVGRSRVYFRTGALEFLGAKRLEALSAFATTLQRVARGFTARSQFWKAKYATIDSQANARRIIARRSFLRSKSACVVLECWVRCVYAKREMLMRQQEKASIILQSRWRKTVAVVVLSKCRSASTMIQKVTRGAVQRPKYREALKESKEEARVNSKLAALQKRLQEAEMKYFQADKRRIEAEKRAEAITEGTVSQAQQHILVDDDESEEEMVKGTRSSISHRNISNEKSEQTSSLQQQLLIDESQQMLEYFQKEVFKLKSANYLLRTDLAEARQEFKSIVTLNEALQASHSALKKTTNKVSTNNMRLSANAAAHRDAIAKLKQELMMVKMKHNSEMKVIRDEHAEKERRRDKQTTKLRRELEGLRKVAAKTPETTSMPPSEYKRASFEASSRNAPLRSRNAPAISRTNSLTEISATSTVSSMDEWGHDGYFSRNSRTDDNGKGREWTVVVSPKRKQRTSSSSRPPSGRNVHKNPNSNPRYGGKKQTLHSTTSPPSSLATAAASGSSRGPEHSKKEKHRSNVKRSASQKSLSKLAKGASYSNKSSQSRQASGGGSSAHCRSTPKVSNKKTPPPPKKQ